MTRATTLWLLPLVSVGLLGLGAGDASKTRTKKPPEVAGPTDPGLTDPMRLELGAAAWIPEDASYFSATLRLGEQWTAISQSRAWGKLLSLPAVQMVLQQMREHPLYLQFLEGREKIPLLASALEIAPDAVSQEIFFYADARIKGCIAAAVDVYMETVLQGLRSDFLTGPDTADRAPPSALPAVVSKVLQHEKAIRVPPILVGFRVSRPEAARDFLASLVKTLGPQLPVPLEEESIGTGKFHTLRLGASLIPPAVRAGLSEGLRREGIKDDVIKRFNAFVDSQTVALSAGLRGDYLLFSVGPDVEHLKKLGQGRSLAESKAFGPLRRHWKPRAASIVYVDADLHGRGKIPADGWVRVIDRVLEALPAKGLPEGLVPRIKKDARSLLDDINRDLPETAPFVSASFLNRGLETYSFSSPDPTLDAGMPLSILSRAGNAPLLAVASRSARLGDTYSRFTKWVKVAYGYFEDYVVPRIPKQDRAEFDHFRTLFIPAIAELHETTEKLLLPAIGGCQELLAVDKGGVLNSLPGSAEPLVRPIKYPRPAFLLEPTDVEKLKDAFAKYRETLMAFQKRAGRELGFRPVEIPLPVSRQHAGGTLYKYALPFSLGPDFEPHALLSGKAAVLSLSPTQSKEMVESSASVPDSVIELAAPAGLVYSADLRGLSGLLLEDIAIILVTLKQQGAIPAEQAKFIGAHLQPLKQALGAIKSWRGRVYVEDGFQVHHSWLEVEDLTDG